MSKVDTYFRMAAIAARNGDSKEAERQYWIGAVGVRKDGAVVSSNNVPSRLQEPAAHAESRLCRKLDRGATVYVVRLRRSGGFALARPCRHCRKIMRNRGVKRCYYTITSNEYGVMTF